MNSVPSRLLLALVLLASTDDGSYGRARISKVVYRCEGCGRTKSVKGYATRENQPYCKECKKDMTEKS